MIAVLFVVANAALTIAGAPQSVEIVVIGTPADLQRVRELVDPGRLGGAPPRWTRADRFDPTEVLRPGTALRCWVDLSHPQQARARVTFAARSNERFLVRDVELSGRFDELDRQSLAQVLELSVAALLEDQPAGLSRDEARALLLPPSPPRPPTPTPPSTPPPHEPGPTSLPLDVGASASTAPSVGPPATRRLHPGFFYAAKLLGGGLPLVHGPGLSLEWRGSLWPRPLSAWTEGQAQLPARFDGTNISLDLFTVAVRVGFGLGWLVDDRADGGVRKGRLRLRRLVTRLGGGLDFVRLSPQPGTTDGGAVVLAPPRWSESLVISAAVGLGLDWGTLIALELRLVTDLLPTSVHYDLASEGEARPVFSPWRVRPGLALALMF